MNNTTTNETINNIAAAFAAFVGDNASNIETVKFFAKFFTKIDGNLTVNDEVLYTELMAFFEANESFKETSIYMNLLAQGW